MPELPPALSGVVVTVIAGCLYTAIWRVTRDLGGWARALARTTPMVVIVPGLIYLSLLLALQGEDAEAEAILLPRLPAVAPHAATRLAAVPPKKQAEAAGIAPAATPPARADAGDGAGLRTPVGRSLQHMAASVPRPHASANNSGGWDVVPVLYGTDRLREVGAEPVGNGGPRRIAYGPDRAHRLELGQALVTVPAAHQVPTIERPFALRVPYLNIVLYEQAEDPKLHFTVKEVKVLPRDKFLALARERLGAGGAFSEQALVFVHGYNTTFDDALYRTAQIAYDLKFDGAVFLYSWPSTGGVTGYTRDRESATQAEPYLKELLTLVVQESGAKSVSVIAHSMGNLPLLNVLHELGPSLPAGVRLNELILAAPDVDRDVFANLIAGIRGYEHGITLYCSANDRAMIAARQVAGGVPRAGDVPSDGPVILPGVDTIDISETSTDLLALNHSAYAEKSALLNDIGLLLQTGERPPERRIPILQRVSTARGAFWRYP
ncbi:MAG TPA: alpha/beta hydrolase [Hyphomicrobiaceae bacterium]|nr:alpha/beta hydrolase [Hyphomicrobiaceae bacterium]